ncbi:transcriptional regulator with XRE-family HTH domain [Pseudacidovorax sp. 1753]
MLSRIERGLVNPSVEMLERIAAALGVPVTLLFVDPDCRINFSHVLSGQGLAIQGEGVADGYCYQLLGPKLFGRRALEPYLVTVMDEAGPYLSAQKAGVKFIQMISGEVRYRVGSPP